jgi:hypothetical protein
MWEKNVMTNEIAVFDDLNFFLIIISIVLTVKYVIGFVRFVRILQDQWKW